MKESELLSFSLKYLKSKGIVHWRVANGPVMHTIGKRVFFKPSPIKGMPDIAGIMSCGRFFALELKSAKGRLSPEQVTWINKINDTNGVALVIRTSNELIEFCHAILNDDVIH
jgi:VRR-NUC domain